MSSSDDEIHIPQMIGLEALTRIIVAYLKSGADTQGVSYDVVSQLANVSPANVRRNTPFLEYIGLLEGERPNFKLTEPGKQYAQAINWGRIKDAGEVLEKELRNNVFISKILAYVDINTPVVKEDLISRIALIANVPNERRFRTGINGLMDMLIFVELLKETNDGIILSEKRKTFTADSVIVQEKKLLEVSESVSDIPINININLNSNTVDVKKLKQIIKAIREALSESN